jgi:uncharacterized protein (UPF0297 family)
MNKHIDDFVKSLVNKNLRWFTDSDIDMLATKANLDHGKIRSLLLERKLMHLDSSKISETLKKVVLPKFFQEELYRVYLDAVSKFKKTLSEINPPIDTQGLDDIHVLTAYLIHGDDGSKAVTYTIINEAVKYRRGEIYDKDIANELEKVKRTKGKGMSPYNQAISGMCDELLINVYRQNQSKAFDSTMRKHMLDDVWKEIDSMKKSNPSILRTAAYADAKIERIIKQQFSKEAAIWLYNEAAGISNSHPYFDFKYFSSFTNKLVSLCPNCHNVVEFESSKDRDSSNCPHCGQSFTRICPLCKQATSITSDSCSNCEVRFSVVEGLEDRLKAFDKINALYDNSPSSQLFLNLETVIETAKSQLDMLPVKYATEIKKRCEIRFNLFRSKINYFITSELKSNKPSIDKVNFAINALDKYGSNEEVESYIRQYLSQTETKLEISFVEASDTAIKVNVSFDNMLENKNLSYYIVRNDSRIPQCRTDGVFFKINRSPFIDEIPATNRIVSTNYALFPVLNVSTTTFEFNGVTSKFEFKQYKVKCNINAAYLPYSTILFSKIIIEFDRYILPADDQDISATLIARLNDNSTIMIENFVFKRGYFKVPFKSIKSFNKIAESKLSQANKGKVKAFEYHFELIAADPIFELIVDKPKTYATS